MRVQTYSSGLLLDSKCIQRIRVVECIYCGRTSYYISAETNIGKELALSEYFLNLDEAETSFNEFVTALDTDSKSFSFSKS